MVGHKFLGGAGWVVASTTLERWLRPRRRGRGTPLSSNVHRTRAQWPGGSWDFHSGSHAPELLHLELGEYPRNRVREKRSYGPRRSAAQP